MALRFAGIQTLSLEGDFPAAVCFLQRRKQSFLVVAFGRTRTCIQAGRQHRAVKSDPAKALPKINLQRGEIAEPQNNFGIRRRGNFQLI